MSEITRHMATHIKNMENKEYLKSIKKCFPLTHAVRQCIINMGNNNNKEPWYDMFLEQAQQHNYVINNAHVFIEEQIKEEELELEEKDSDNDI